MKYLVSSDTHFSEKPKDRYRFGLFLWLLEQQTKYKPDATFILGDLTESKDRHTSALVNDIVYGLTLLRPPIYILKGNHDYIDVGMPFFHFLHHIDGLMFATQAMDIPEFGVTMIPHQTSQTDMNDEVEAIPSGYSVFLHNTFDGAIAETGQRMGGLVPPPRLFKAPWCVSGDIHRPQQVGPITYVGAPYQVRHGDDYSPRALLIDDDKFHDLYFPAPRKWSLTVRDAFEITHNENLKPNDQVKVTIQLAREEVVDWAKIKEQVLQACYERQLEVFGLELKLTAVVEKRIKEGPTGKTNDEIFAEFCKTEDVPSQVKRAGSEVIGGNDGFVGGRNEKAVLNR